MNTLYLVFVGGVGLIIGSFLNALIYRLNTEESVLKGRSHCMDCGRVLTWHELVPVFSFIVQKGKCRGCGKKISWQYPLIEISTAMLFVSVFEIFNFEFLILNQFLIFEFLKLIFLWIVVGGLIVIFVYDLKHYLIPDKVLLPLIFATILAHLINVLNFEFWSLEFISDFGFRYLDFESLSIALLIAVLSALPFAVLHFASSGKAMGFGDVKLAFFMGLFLGYPAVLTAMFIAFIMGAIIGTGLMVLGQSTMKSRVPFGPFLVAGTFMALFWGESLSLWYINLFY